METSSEESNIKNTTIKKYHKYTIEEKIKIIDEIEKTSLNAVNKKYGIAKKCLLDWRDNKNKLIIVPNKRFKYRLGHSGQKSVTYQNRRRYYKLD